MADTANITKRLATFLAETDLSGLSSQDVEMARLCLMDWLAVTIAGCREPLGDMLFDLTQEMGGSGQASIVGRSKRTSVLNAALVNGSVSHALDYDDVHLKMIGHPTVPVAPAVLALAEWKGLSGRAVIEAFTLGLETETQVSAGVNPPHYMSGYHSTGTIGTFGAAAASGRLLGLEAEKMIHCLGLAGTQAAGLRQVFGTMAKPFHAGKAAMNGLLSALLAEKGFTSSTDMLEGAYGFTSTLSSEGQPEKIVEGLGDPYDISDVQFKLHASCFMTHPAIDAALALTDPPDPESIETVTVTVHPDCTNIANIKRPLTGLEGKFSIPFCTALSLTEARTDEVMFTDENARRPDLVTLLEKVQVFEEDGPLTHMAEICVTTSDGRTIEASADTLALGRDRDVRKRKVEEKFKHLVSGALGQGKMEELFIRMSRLEDQKDVGKLSGFWNP